jgi:hypothetical protein
MSWQAWNHLLDLHSKTFICGFCGDKVGAHKGYNNSSNGAIILICPNCGRPTYFVADEQYPGPLLGRNIDKLPQDIQSIYREIRNSIKDANYTAAQLLGRKLIMHLAVSVANAKEGETFVQYVEHLKQAGYVPPNGETWINYVKKQGNEKNHEINIGTIDESQKILKFIEVLLIFIYEFAEAEEETNGAE